MNASLLRWLLIANALVMPPLALLVLYACWRGRKASLRRRPHPKLGKDAVRYGVENGATWVRRQDDRRA